LINTHGYASFASDSFGCHQQAIELKQHLKDFEWSLWWNIESRFHTRLASIAYALWGEISFYSNLSMWPFNAAALYLSWSAWCSLVRQLGGPTPKKSLLWLALPLLNLHFTQLLRDPFYIAALLFWLEAWISLFKEDNPAWLKKIWWKIVFISPFLYLVRERFWVISQVVTLIWFLFALHQKYFNIKTWSWFRAVLFLIILLNSGSIYNATLRLMGLSPQSVLEDPLAQKPFVFFYKIAALRRDFIESYQQASSLDTEVQFESDVDVIAYLPRALSISFLMPLPNMWFEANGKTGLTGRLLSGLEMMLMWMLVLQTLVFFIFKKASMAQWMCIAVILVHYTALGLVITNGGALYRMRFALWLVWIALAISAGTLPCLKHQHRQLEKKMI